MEKRNLGDCISRWSNQNFHSFYTPNFQRHRCDRTRRRVNTLACRKFELIIFLPLYRLALSISLLGSCLGASYSTFCNVYLFIIMIIAFSIIFRQQKVRICNRNTPFSSWVPSKLLHALYLNSCRGGPHYQLVHRLVCRWGQGLSETSTKRSSNGHIHFSTSFYFTAESGI
jgi:hypothetical protein